MFDRLASVSPVADARRACLILALARMAGSYNAWVRRQRSISEAASSIAPDP